MVMLVVDELAKTAAKEGIMLNELLLPEPITAISLGEPVDLKNAQQDDPILQDAIKRKQKGKPIEEGPLSAYDSQLVVHNHILLFNTSTELVWVPPTGLRYDILYHIHNQGGHLGSEKVKDRLAGMFWWPDMRKDADTHCLNCLTCAQMNPAHKKERAVETCLSRGGSVDKLTNRLHWTTSTSKGWLQIHFSSC